MPTISVDYLNIQDSNASPSMTWYAGDNSIDSGNNFGWIFTSSPSDTMSQNPGMLMFLLSR